MLHRQITRFSRCQDKPKMLLPSVTFESCVIINRHVMDKLQGFLDSKINPLDIYRGLSSKLRHDQRNVTSTNYKVFSMPRQNLLDITAVFPRNYVTINVMLNRQITRF